LPRNAGAAKLSVTLDCEAGDDSGLRQFDLAVHTPSRRVHCSGEEALELFQANSLDAVALDYLLPGMKGEEAARRIRAACANTIIIIYVQAVSRRATRGQRF